MAQEETAISTNMCMITDGKLQNSGIERIINGMKIEHIAMYVSDLEKAKDFFTTYFGAAANSGYHNTKTGFRSFFLTFEDGARLEIMSRSECRDMHRDPYRYGYAHIAFSVGSCEKVDALTNQLRNAGFEVTSGPRTTGDGYYESCILGFEGNLIEITV